MTAYFNGTFQRQDNPNNKFDAQFQIKFQASTVRVVFLQIQHWNNKYLNSEEMYFNIWIGSNYQQLVLEQIHT